MLETDLTRGGPAEATSPVIASGIDGAGFRSIMGSWLSGVSVVSAMGDGRPFGLTCSALCSVSGSPPLLLVSINSASSTLATIVEAGAFTVSLLDADSRAISEMFAAHGHWQFDDIDWYRGDRTGMPVLAAALAHAECDLHDVVEAGDHSLVLGRVVAGTADLTRDPLGYWRRNYLQLADAIERQGHRDTATTWIGEL